MATRATHASHPSASLRALDGELYRDVVPGRVRVGTDLLVRLTGESFELRLRERRVPDMQLHREAEAAGVARPDRDAAGDGCALGVLLLLHRDIVERAAEAGGVAHREQMLRRRRVGSARTAHGLGNRETDRDGMIRGFPVTIAA